MTCLIYLVDLLHNSMMLEIELGHGELYNMGGEVSTSDLGHSSSL